MSLCPANASNTELLNGISKQRRLFNKLSRNLGLEAIEEDENPFDEQDSNSKSNPELRLWEELLKTRQRYTQFLMLLKFSPKIQQIIQLFDHYPSEIQWLILNMINCRKDYTITVKETKCLN